jgi:hypothetical protein
MKSRMPSIVFGAICAAIALSQQVLADDAACQTIAAANSKSFASGASMNSKITKTGVDFIKATPQIYGFYTKLTCAYIRDESLNGESVSVYSQRYEAAAGTTNAQIWISKKTGLLLREEMDGDLGPKGKGHESMIFGYAK